MTYLKPALTLIMLVFHFTSTAGSQELPPALKRPVEYDREIRPLLKKHCLGCHGEKKQKGKLRLDLLSNLLSGGESGEPRSHNDDGLCGAGYRVHVCLSEDVVEEEAV